MVWKHRWHAVPHCMVRPFCVGFTLGVNGSNSCPVNSVRIETEEQCRSAAAEVAKNYAGKETSSSYPKGCYLFRTSSVYFNMDVNGVGRPGSQLICATVPIGAPPVRMRHA